MGSEGSDNLAVARRYFRGIEQSIAEDALAEFFTSDVVQEEYPNRLVPQGARRDLAAILEGSRQGRKVMSAQSFEVLHAVAHGDDVALEVLWTGTLAIDFGTIPAGGQMRAHFALFLRFRDGKIARQANYDCFEPW